MQHTDTVWNHLYCCWTNGFYVSRWRILKCPSIKPLCSSLPGTPCPTQIHNHSLPSFPKPLFVPHFLSCSGHIYLVVLSPLPTLLFFSVLSLSTWNQRSHPVVCGQLHWSGRLGGKAALTLLNVRASFLICKVLISSFWTLYLRGCLWDSLVMLWTATRQWSIILHVLK